ncbi:hypothetical protein lerEdw1_001652 [Lerista edwardsae]|nr:hypothetical protein lerEdw1_001652 [Lerista edwardsae]
MEFYESTYFIVLVPSVVIAVIFLFFWLFMKETLYDEALAKQKRDQKFAPAKTDKKKAEKKKSKKKEAQNGNLHESDSENAARDFKLSDALGADEEHLLPVSLSVAEAPSSLRERKKKEKKHKASPEEHVPKESDGSKPGGKKVEPVPVTKQPTPPSDAAGSKKKAGQKKQKNGIDEQDAKSDSFLSPTKKQEPTLLHHEIKQESGSGKKKVSAKKQKTDNVMTLVDEPLIHPTTYIPLMDNADQNSAVEKREAVDVVKQDGIEGLQKSNAKKLKNETDKENAEVKFKDFLLAMKNMLFTEEEALCVVELLKEKSNAIQDVLQKANKGDTAAALHQLQEKDKLIVAVKEEAAVAKEQCKHLSQFQQLREQMEAEINRLKQENGILRDAVSTSTNQMESKYAIGDSTETSVVQSSELNKLRQDCARLVNELTEKNNKLQQEELLKKNAEQAVNQLKVQQQEAERRWEEMQSYLRKRTAEHEAAQQGVLKGSFPYAVQYDFVFSVNVQNKLVTKDNEIQSLHSKLTDTMVSKQQLEQRMMQLMEAEQKRVTAEDSIQRQMQELVEQNDALKAQLQKFHSQMAVQSTASAIAEELHKVIAEKDKQISQTEDSLASERIKLTSKEEDLMVVQNMNMSLKAEVQKLQARANEQAAAAQELERMQKSTHVKDDKIRGLEEQLQGHHAKASNAMEEVQNLKDQNKTLQLEIQKLKALLSEQTNKELLEQMEISVREKDDKIKTVEELLEAGLIEMANKEEELKVLRTENTSLKSEVENLQRVQTEQVSFASLVEELQKVISEKDGKIKSVEELLQAEALKVSAKEKKIQALTEETEALKEEIGKKAQLEEDTQIGSCGLKGREDQVRSMEVLLKEKEREIAKKGECLQSQEDTLQCLKNKVKELEELNSQQISAASLNKELEALLKAKQEEVQKAETLLDEKGQEVAHQRKEFQAVQEENRLLRAQVQEIKQENGDQMLQGKTVCLIWIEPERCLWSPVFFSSDGYADLFQASLAIRNEQLLQLITGKEREIASLQKELGTLKHAVEQQRQKNNERQQHAEVAQAEMRDVLQKLFPMLCVPSNLSHSEWMCSFEKAVKEHTKETSPSQEVKAMEQKLREADELHVMLQQECEKYKAVLAETEGILQRLQRSVEEEESKWKIKTEESQQELQQVRSSVIPLEHEVERLKEEIKAVDSLKKEREHLEHELEKAEIERSTYVSEVRELKTQLNETLSKLKLDQSERQKIAVDLPKAQESLVTLEREMGNAVGDASVIENSDVCSQTAGPGKNLNTGMNLCQDFAHLKKLLASVSQMLAKGKEHYQLLEDFYPAFPLLRQRPKVGISLLTTGKLRHPQNFRPVQRK